MGRQELKSILDARLAKGEIALEEYKRLCSELEIGAAGVAVDSVREVVVESRAARYARNAFLVTLFLMVINPANCSAGREHGGGEYIVRVIMLTIIFGFFASVVTYGIQRFRERK